MPDVLLRAVLAALDEEDRLRTLEDSTVDATRRREQILQITRGAVASWSSGHMSATAAAVGLEEQLLLVDRDEETDRS